MPGCVPSISPAGASSPSQVAFNTRRTLPLARHSRSLRRTTARYVCSSRKPRLLPARPTTPLTDTSVYASTTGSRPGLFSSTCTISALHVATNWSVSNARSHDKAQTLGHNQKAIHHVFDFGATRHTDDEARLAVGRS